MFEIPPLQTPILAEFEPSIRLAPSSHRAEFNFFFLSHNAGWNFEKSIVATPAVVCCEYSRYHHEKPSKTSRCRRAPERIADSSSNGKTTCHPCKNNCKRSKLLPSWSTTESHYK